MVMGDEDAVMEKTGVGFCKVGISKQEYTGGWFSNIVYFHPYLGKISNLIDIFQMG